MSGLDLEIAQGEFVAFIGPSGCGKTTLLRILAGLEAATSGSVEILGKTPKEACREAEIGVAFQRPALVESRTARRNVQLSLEITGASPRRSVESLLTQFGIGDFMDHYPYELSGGMQQRVNIACALVHNPEVILLDEPFGALDELTRESLGEWLSGVLREGQQTGILITHSVDEAVMLADRVFVLSARPGKIAEVFDIPFEQPRSRTLRSSPEFLQRVSEVRTSLYAVTERVEA
ncbi:MAG: ABC transporter ATP-binding protein [Opitutales bacterium]